MKITAKLPTARDRRVRWTGCAGAAAGIYLSHAAARLDGPVLFLAPDAASAERAELELRFFLPLEIPVLTFPGYETLPYDRFSPHPDIISCRLRTLSRLPLHARGIVVTDLGTALQRLPPRSFVDAQSLNLVVGEDLDLEAFRGRLAAAGYASVPQVGSPGEFAIRGSLFDVFPMGSEQPLRIDLLDRQIDSIRSFDPDSQRSAERLPRVELLPAREFSLDPDSIRDFRRRYRTRFLGDLTRM